MRRCVPLALLALALPFAAAAAPDKMQAVEVRASGNLTVETRPVPRPGPGEVLIHVQAAGVNPVDWKSARRRIGMVPGLDVAGTIDSVGEGVGAWKRGDAVLGIAPGSGSYAEYALVPVTDLGRKPKSLSFAQAAGVPTAAETAYRALHESGRLASGQTVLIHGAAGGVGSAAVQVAKAAGARVIATASAANHDFLRSLGADVLVDYRAQRFEDVARDVDLVLNTVDAATNARSIGVVKAGGTLVSIVAPADPRACAAARIRCVRPDRETGAPAADLLERVAALADAGRFTVFVEKEYALDEAEQAWLRSRSGHTRGKLVILPRMSGAAQR